MILVCTNCEGKEFRILSDKFGLDVHWLAICQCGAVYRLDHQQEQVRVVYMPKPSRPTDGGTAYPKDVCT